MPPADLPLIPILRDWLYQPPRDFVTPRSASEEKPKAHDEQPEQKNAGPDGPAQSLTFPERPRPTF